MNLAAFALRHKPVVMTAIVLVCLFGVNVFLTISRREDPEYVVRVCQVLTNWPGTPTERVEELITSKLEDEINTMDGLRWVRSETTLGRSVVFVELDRDYPGPGVMQKWDEVRARVKRVPMPEPGIQPIVIDDYGATNILTMALHQRALPGESGIQEENRYTLRDLDIFSERLADDLKLVQGVSKVTRIGVLDEAIYIETDMGTWTQLSLTSSELSELVQRRNIVSAGGVIDTRDGRFAVNPSGDIDAERELNAIVVGKVGDDGARAPVYLQDVGLEVVRDYIDPPEVLARFGDTQGPQPCVLVSFTMKSGANIVDVCDDAKALVRRLVEDQKALPPDVAVTYISDQSENVTAKITDFVWNVVVAVAIVVAVVFLMVGLRSAVVMAANIPVVIIAAVAFMPFFDVQLEQISIASMIIALGLLVDNAVQISNESRRLQELGSSPQQAGVEGARLLARAILFGTATTVAAFLPMVFCLKGTAQEYVRSLPITLTLTLALSYVIALTFCTLLSTWFIKPQPPGTPLSPLSGLWRMIRPARSGAAGGSLLSRLYPAVVELCLKRRFAVVIVSFGLLGVVMALPVGSQFFPQDLRDQFAIDIWLPEGSNIRQTDEVARQVESIVRRLSSFTDDHGNEVQRLRAMATIVGGGAARWHMGRNPESQMPYYAEIVVRTTDGALTPGLAEDVKRVARTGDPARGFDPIVGALVSRQLGLGPPVDSPIGIRIFAPRLGPGFADPLVMREQASKLASILRRQPGAWGIRDTWGAPGFELGIDIDPDKANLAGVTNLAVADTLDMYFSGNYLTTFREQDHLIPVYLRLPAEQRRSLDQLPSAYVEGIYGKVPLDAVAELESRWYAARVDRRFLQRVIEVRGYVEEGYRANDIVLNMTATDEFKKWARQLPPGYWWQVGGELFETQTSKPDMMTSFSVSLMVIPLLLIMQYNGFAKPLIIIATLPLALIGAFLGLYITGKPFGFMPQLGLLSLFGIVVNTAIIFIEFADTLIAERIRSSDGRGPIMGMTVAEFRDCLVRAGQMRLLPIAMTTLTTIGGLLPLAMAGGPLWEGMSWLMIFGLGVATLLTLIVVPCLYAIFVENFGMAPIQQD